MLCLKAKYGFLNSPTGSLYLSSSASFSFLFFQSRCSTPNACARVPAYVCPVVAHMRALVARRTHVLHTLTADQ